MIRTNLLPRIVLLIALASYGYPGWSAPAGQVGVKSVCEVSHNSQSYSGKEVTIRALFESDGREHTTLMDTSCRDVGIEVMIYPDTQGWHELEAALRKGMPGTVDKTITGTFVGVFSWRPGEIPVRTMSVNKISDITVEPGPNPMSK